MLILKQYSPEREPDFQTLGPSRESINRFFSKALFLDEAASAPHEPPARGAPRSHFTLSARSLPGRDRKEKCPFFPRTFNLALEHIKSFKTTTLARSGGAASQKGVLPVQAPRWPGSSPCQAGAHAAAHGRCGTGPLPAASPGPHPPGRDSKTNPGLALCLTPSFNPLRFLSQMFYELPRPKVLAF